MRHILFYIAFSMGSVIIVFGSTDPLSESLMIADSLFNEKKFTQSFEIYEDIRLHTGKASPSMLLKMAFIKEGLGDFTDALYYLNLYYLKTYNRRVLKKMENLGETYHLEGYNYADTEFFLNLYHQYRIAIIIGLSSTTLLLFFILFYKKRSSKSKPVLQGIFYIVLLFLLFLLNNFGREKPKAIVTANQTYLMEGPSPGSEVIEIVGRGHRVDVLGRDDVWTRINWKDQVAYVKEHNLKRVRL